MLLLCTSLAPRPPDASACCNGVSQSNELKQGPVRANHYAKCESRIVADGNTDSAGHCLNKMQL